MVLVYDASGYTAASDAQFAPLSFGGMWVKALADDTTPYSIVGSGNRLTELGGNGVTPYFKFDKSFTIDRSSETKIISNNYNPVIFDIAEGATFTNTSRLNIVGGATLKLTGKGTLAVPGGLDIQGGSTPTALDISSADCPLIDGDVTATGSGAVFILPAGTAFDADLDIQVCTGTLKATAGKVIVMIGGAITTDVYITTSGGKITRLSTTGDYYVSVAEDAQWDTASWSPSVPTGDLTGKVVAINIASGKTLALPASLQGATVYVTGDGVLTNDVEAVTTLTDVTLNGPINAAGTVKTAGTTLLNGSNVFGVGSLLEIVSGETSLKTANQGVKGNLTVDAGATLKSLTTDAVWYYEGNTSIVAIYGTLDLGTTRWSLRSKDYKFKFQTYPGANIIGYGDGNAALDLISGGTFNIYAMAGESSEPVTVSAPIRVNCKAQFAVDSGVTVNCSSAITTKNNSVEFNLTGSGTLVLSGSITHGGPRYISNDGTLIYAGVNDTTASAINLQNGGKVVLRGGTDAAPFYWSGNVVIKSGTFEVEDGSVVKIPGQITNLTVNSSAKVQIQETFESTGSATIILGAGATIADNVELLRADGTEITDAVASGDSGAVTLTYTPQTAGNVCWYDFEFNGSLKSVGSNTTTLNRDTSNGIANNISCYTTDNDAIYTVCDAYMSITYPTEWSASIYAKLPAVQNAILMAFGTKDDGCVALIGGDPAKNEVLLVRTTGNSKYTTLATMTVPNATTSSHLYTFCKSDKKIAIYLDKTLWTTYESASSITFGNGFQIGSLYSGCGNTGMVQYGRGYYNADDLSANSTIGVLRIYQAVLGQNMVNALAEEFPYVSPNGSYTLAVSDAESVLSATEAWENAATQARVDLAVNGSAATINATVDTVLTVNADLQTESLTVNGNVVFAKDSDGHNLQNQGLTTISGNVTIEYGAASISGGPTVVASGKVVFDYTNYVAPSFNSVTYVQLTGLMDEDASKVELIAPEDTDLCSFSLAYHSGAYCICITPDHAAGAEIYWDASNGQTYWGDGNNAAKFYMSYVNGEFSDETVYLVGDTVVVPDTTQRWYGPLSDGAKIKFDCDGVINVDKTQSIGYCFENTEVTVAEGTTLNFMKSGNADPVVYGGSVKGAGKIAVGDGVTLTFTNGENSTYVATEIECTGTGNVMFAQDEKLGAGETFTLKSGAVSVGRNGDARWFIVNGAGGTINLDGGVLSVCRLTPNAAMNVNFNGGTLKSYGDGSSYGTIVSGNNTTAKVLAGGAIIDTDVYNTSITTVLASGVTEGADGGLVKKGTGTLTLTVAPTFTGAVSVEAGALYVPAGATLNLAEGTVKAEISDKEGYDKYEPAPTGTACEDGSGNNFTVPTTVVVPNEKTLADATGKGTTYAQAYALGLWDGTAEDEVDDMPEATISIADGVVTVTFTGVSSDVYTIKKWLQEKASLTEDWPETPTEENSTLIEGDSATDAIGSGEDAQFYRVVVTIEDK